MTKHGESQPDGVALNPTGGIRPRLKARKQRGRSANRSKNERRDRMLQSGSRLE
jgi:hypothetical protein